MRKLSVLLISLVLGSAVISATSVKAYVLYDHIWPSATTTFYVDLPGTDGKWNTAFEQAMGRWNAATIFEFRMLNTFESPCDGLPAGTDQGDFENGVGFVSDVCGEAFGANVVATNGSWSLGTRTLQSNIYFNNAYSWDVYDGPYGTGQWAGIVDFRRFAVHELGHVLGLGHEDDIPSIMATAQFTGNTIVAPQADDIAGVAALYSGVSSGTSLPSAPFLLRPSNGATGVSLTPLLDWLASANADSYDVYFGTSSNPAFAANLARSSYSPGSLAPNTVYHWRVVARNSLGTSSSATYRFTTIDSRPPNDLFTRARVIVGPSGTTNGSNVDATEETGEPGRGTKSVWWGWRPPSSGTVTIDTAGSSFDTILGVYTGTMVDMLSMLEENDDNGGLQSRVSLDVAAGTVYWFRVAGFSDSEGLIVLNWNFEAERTSVQDRYIITAVAGVGKRGFGGDGGPAVRAHLNEPTNMAVDGAGNVYIADGSNHRIRKVDPEGTITTFAGTGEQGFSGDGSPAVQARLNRPSDVAVDGAGNLYIADFFNLRIRRVDPEGTITTVAGNGQYGFSGDEGPAVQAQFRGVSGVAADEAGNLYIADGGNHRIRRVDPEGTISTIAGTGEQGVSGDDGPAVQAHLNSPRSLAVDVAGNVYIADRGNHRIRKVDPSGIISTIAGTGEVGFGGDDGPAIQSRLHRPISVAVDGAGNVYIADNGNSRIRRVDPSGTIFTFAGNGEQGLSGDGGPAVQARLGYVSGVAVDGVGNLYIADGGNHRIRRVDPSGTISTFAGIVVRGVNEDGGPAVQAHLNSPRSLAVDVAGNLYIADRGNHRIRKVDPSGTISTFAGTGEQGTSGDGGPAVQARLNGPSSVAVDGDNNVYIADRGNRRIRRVDSSGTISTFAGTGERGVSGDGGPAVQARLGYISDVEVDRAGNVYITNSGSQPSDNHSIRRVAPSGTISTFAGTGEQGTSGDGGPAVQARLNGPSSVALDRVGNVYIADRGNHRIRRVDFSGIITTFAGNGEQGFSGDGRPATQAWLNHPTGVAVDGAGNVYIADTYNYRIRRVDPEGTIVTIAGTGEEGFSGDEGPAVQARLHEPHSVAVDGAGNVYITDNSNDRIRKLTPVGGSTPTNPTGPASTQPFFVTDRGGVSLSSQGVSPTTVSGYGKVQADEGMTAPDGLAIFGFRHDGILVSEAGVPAVEAVLEGRIFAETDGAIRTGLAIANPNDSAAAIAFFFTDINGMDHGHGSLTLEPGEQRARFLDEAPFNGGSGMLGTFTFTSNLPVAVIALRGFVNERSEFLMTTLPVAPLSAPAGRTVYFPHFTDGGGWTTQVILVNPTDDLIGGSVQFRTQGSATTAAGPAALTLADGQTGSEFSYSILPRSATRLETANPAGSTQQSGSVRVVADAGSSVPSGVSVFTFERDGVTVSEAGVPATDPAAAMRVYVEASGTPGQSGAVRSGIALTNTSGFAAAVSFELTALDGTPTGPAESLTIPGSGQVAQFIDEFFPALTPPFSGILRIASTPRTPFSSRTRNLAAIGLRLTTNGRGDVVVTTTPPSEEDSGASASALFFPHFVDSGGWTTQFILYSRAPGRKSSGSLVFTAQDGQPLELPVSATSAQTIP